MKTRRELDKTDGEVEIAGGEKVRLEPGHVLLAEDLTGKGHITRTLGSED